MSSIHNVNFAMLILLNNTYNYSYIYKQIQCVLSAGQYVLKIYDHKCCNGRVWFLHEQFGFSLQYWHEQGFLLVWVLSLKWNLVQSSRFQCPHCKSKFSQKHNLKRHVKQKHEENVESTKEQVDDDKKLENFPLLSLRTPKWGYKK